MAIYHLHAKVLSRKNGQSAVAAAAYRSGESLWSEADQSVKRQSKNRHVVRHTEIMAPESASEWAVTREDLWNEVEYRESRSTRPEAAKLAREIELALPRELDLAKQVQLVRDFVIGQFTAEGMIADIALHESTARDGQSNPHAHIMLTLREITPDGFGNKVRDWNRKHQLIGWRKAWTNCVNAALDAAGIPAAVDDRSYQEQEIDRIPQPKLGPHVAAMEKRGIRTDRGEQWRKSMLENLNREIPQSGVPYWELLEQRRQIERKKQREMVLAE